jgi:hypothetical protein
LKMENPPPDLPDKGMCEPFCRLGATPLRG